MISVSGEPTTMRTSPVYRLPRPATPVPESSCSPPLIRHSMTPEILATPAFSRGRGASNRIESDSNHPRGPAEQETGAEADQDGRKRMLANQRGQFLTEVAD